MKVSKRKCVISLLCVIALLLGSLLTAFADNGPTVTVNSVTVAPGASVTVTVSGKNFENISALELLVSYDTNVFRVASTSSYSKMTAESINTKNAGFVQYSGISAVGLSGNPSLFRITFTANASAAEQTYSLPIMITEAQQLVDEANVDVSMSTTAGQITVRETQTTPSVTFSKSLSSKSIISGNDVQFKIYCSNTKKLAAGQFAFSYDSDLFTYKSLELLSPMTSKEHVSTVNSSNPGQVVLAYTAQESISNGYLMTLTLTAKEGKSGSGEIVFTPLSLYDAEGNALLYSASGSSTVSVSQKEEDPVYPKVWLSGPKEASANSGFVVDVYVEGSSGLAAADFAITYDASQLVCELVSTTQKEDGENITVVINDNYKNGTVNFSMICSQGISEDTKLVSIRFHAKSNVQTKATITPSVSDPKDKDVQPVTLVCENLSVSISKAESGGSGSSATGTVLSWNNNDDAMYILYPSTITDDAIKEEWTSGMVTGVVCLNKETATTVISGGKTMYMQAFTFSDISEGEYKLAIFKQGKYIPKIVSVSVSGFFSTFEQQKLWLYGDVNYDGKVNATDATQILRFFNNKTPNAFSSGTEDNLAEIKVCADVNKDGKINATDATQILRYFNNKTPNAFANIK